LIPASWNWNSAWKSRPCASQPRCACQTQASAHTAVTASSIAAKRSTTSTMPNGAGQLPSA
jgi:hypothetical protein